MRLKKDWGYLRLQIRNYFHAGELNLESINTGFIILILKIHSPQRAKDFRPITLLNCCLKLITKLLAQVLRQIL